MKHEYKIGGMTCESCAAKVKSKLLVLPHVISVEVSKATDTATIEMSEHIPIGDFQEALIQLDKPDLESKVDEMDDNMLQFWFELEAGLVLPNIGERPRGLFKGDSKQLWDNQKREIDAMTSIKKNILEWKGMVE